LNNFRLEYLLKQYEDATASVAEEQELRQFFSSDNYPPHLRHYADFFRFCLNENEHMLRNKNFDQQIMGILEKDNALSVTRRIYTILAAASVILLLIIAGIWATLDDKKTPAPIADTYSTPDIAYREAYNILMKVSTVINTGTDELALTQNIHKGAHEVERLEAFHKGWSQITTVGAFDESKNKITNK